MKASKRMVGALSIILVVGACAAQAGASRTTAKLRLEWAPGAKSIIGYHIYYGRTPNPAKMQVLPPPPEFDPRAPAIELDVLRDLGALPGQRVCFRVRAYNRVSQSTLSPPMCSVI